MVRQSSNKRVKFWKYYYLNYHYKFLLNANKIVVKFEEFHCDDRKPGFCFLLPPLQSTAGKCDILFHLKWVIV